MGVIGTAVTGLIVSQSKFFGEQSAISNARAVSRSATNILISELRRLDSTGGVVAANNDSITIRVPYRMGVVCGSAVAATTVSLLPVDSLVAATAGFSGYAWRDTITGVYTYREAGVSIAVPTALLCTTNRINTVPGGAVSAVAPAAPGGAGPAVPIFLFQRVTYRFAPSVTLASGQRALWRRVHATAVNEELVAPFDSTAKFRFFVLNNASAQDAPPGNLADLRGIELVLTAINERATRTGGTTSPYTTAVFFNNRLN
jgi:hypothetical protein